MESIIFYKSFFEAIENIPENKQLLLYRALFKYYFYNEEPQLEDTLKAMFKLMKPNIDNASSRYKASVENGKKGGAPKGNQNARKQPKTTQKQPKNNLNKDKDYNKDLNKECECSDDNLFYEETTHTAPPTPTLDELRSYCLENGMEDFNYEKFYNHYESNGWLNKNGTEIQNWKAKVRYWYKDDEQNGKLIKCQNTSRRLG